MDAEGSLEIGEDVEGVLCRVVFGDDAVSLDGRAGIAGIADIDRYPVSGPCEGPLGIAVAKTPIARHVA